MKTRWMAVLLLAVAGVAAYAGALNNPALYDDAYLLAGNTTLNAGRLPSLFTADYSGFFRNSATSWRPVSVLSYIVNRSLFGETWAAWRLCYLAVHIANAILFLLLLGRFVPQGAAFAGAALFLLHPMHSEVINHISYNEDPMAVALLLAAGLLFLRWLGKPTAAGTAGIAAVYALALLSKETAILFPLAVAAWLLADRGRYLGERSGRAALAGLLGLVTAAFLWLQVSVMKNPFEHRAVAPLGRMLADGMPNVLRLLADYLRRFLLPTGLSVTYYYPPSRWTDPAVLAGMLVAACLAGLAAWGVVRRRPPVAAAAVAVLGGLVPVYYNATHPLWYYGYDHYLYAPSLGLIALLLAALAALPGRFPRLAPLLSRAFPAAAGVILILFLAVIVGRNRVWSSNVSLWRDAATKQPRSALARGSYGYALRRAGRPDEAEPELRQAISMNSLYPNSHYNLGLILKERGQTDEAIVEIRRTLELDPYNTLAYSDLAGLYLEKGMLAPAREALATAIAQDPDMSPTHFALGALHIRTGEYSQAQNDFRRVLETEPDNLVARVNLGNALSLGGDPARAEAEYRRVLAVDPRHVQVLGNMGAIRLGQGKLDEAEEWFRKALAVDPAYPWALTGMNMVGDARRAPRTGI